MRVDGQIILIAQTTHLLADKYCIEFLVGDNLSERFGNVERLELGIGIGVNLDVNRRVGAFSERCA